MVHTWLLLGGCRKNQTSCVTTQKWGLCPKVKKENRLLNNTTTSENLKLGNENRSLFAKKKKTQYLCSSIGIKRHRSV